MGLIGVKNNLGSRIYESLYIFISSMYKFCIYYTCTRSLKVEYLLKSNHPYLNHTS